MTCPLQASTLATALSLTALLAFAPAHAAPINRADDQAGKLACEQCDALAGDARSTCQSAAQARFGKR
jgi:hypothetical protein